MHYGSQIEEHQRVRRDAGMFDVSHMLVIDVEGAEARAFLRHLLANDVARLKVPGKALYSCLLNDAAGVLDDLVVYHLGPESFRLVVNAGTADKFGLDHSAARSIGCGGTPAAKARPNDRAAGRMRVPDSGERGRERAATEGLAVFQGASAEACSSATGYPGRTASK